MIYVPLKFLLAAVVVDLDLEENSADRGEFCTKGVLYAQRENIGLLKIRSQT